jgi:hypothetical protein
MLASAQAFGIGGLSLSLVALLVLGCSSDWFGRWLLSGLTTGGGRCWIVTPNKKKRIGFNQGASTAVPDGELDSTRTALSSKRSVSSSG